MRLSTRALAINPSATLALDARAKEMARNGVDVVGFGAGEPDFDTPEYIRQAGIEAIHAGRTRYTPVAGVLALREAVCRKMHRDHGLGYGPGQVLVSSGAKQSLYNAFQALCSPGDEVIIPSPYWVSYVEQVRLAGATPVIVGTRAEDGFRMQPEALREAITPRTRVLVINSPSNPAGVVYSRHDLEQIAEIAVAADLAIVSDEIYEKLVYDGTKHVSIAEIGSEVQERTIIINGVSKTYAMTGWRIGYAVGPADVVRVMANLQGHVTSNASSVGQYAAMAALDGPSDEIMHMRDQFSLRRDRLVERINGMPGLSCRKPSGAFYVFADMSGLVGRELGGVLVRNGDDLAEVLLEKVHVAVVPGSGFGMEEYIRLSYATSLELIDKGMTRLEGYLRQSLEAEAV